jgi:hypothetical protein
MRREIIGILSVLVLLLVLVGGCGDDVGPVLHVSALADTGVKYPGTISTGAEAPYDDVNWTMPANVGSDNDNDATAVVPKGGY